MRIEDESGSSPDLELTTDNQAVDNSEKIGETEDSLLAVIQNVSEQSAKVEDDAGESESPPESEEQVAAADQPESQKEEDFSKLPFGEHPRFKKLVAQKHEFRKLAQSYESDAKQYRDIQTFMDANDLTAEEVAKSLDMLARMKKGDPAEAYELMQERMEQLAVEAGKKLPTDLEDRIEQGYIDRETAQELHQHRVKAERQAQVATSQLERRSQQDVQQQAVAIAQAVQTWEQSTKAADPDFELKVELVKDRVVAHGMLDDRPDILRRMVIQANDGGTQHPDPVLLQALHELMRIYPAELLIAAELAFQTHPDPADPQPD